MNLLKPKKKIVAAAEGMPSPAALSVTPWHVQVGDGYAATYAVTGYPAEVGPAWLDPLLSYPGRVDVAMHIDPVVPQLAARNAATQVLMRQSTQSIDAVAEAFSLTAGEARLLLAAPRGEGLLVAGRSRIPFRSVGSATEHKIAVDGLEFERIRGED